MSAQINLYHPRFLKQRDLLSLGNVLLVATALYLLLAAAGGWVWRDVQARQAKAAASEAALIALKRQVDVATRAAAGRKPSPQLAAELERAESQLGRRADIARLLEGGEIGGTDGFAEYFRGLARQAPQGLWLTGFTIGAAGADMEIRGRVLDPASLPDYIQRLGQEKAFQGRSFAALTMNRAAAAPVVGSARPGAAVSPAPTLGVSAIEFVLLPKWADVKEGAR
ncbi:MAG: PilN domain-containing protein [Burkholderiaceae bacterium]|nr:PilN domain-containing protein [Sulfuritalea sp.]MCF8176182.1 PilN domain-containing protein [Burkholderiaceae bacterium]MCF8183955.1 PilN domain-containing protein [Polynucleobacter sp.]